MRHGYIDPVVSKENTISKGPSGPPAAAAAASDLSAASDLPPASDLPTSSDLLPASDLPVSCKQAYTRINFYLTTKF